MMDFNPGARWQSTEAEKLAASQNTRANVTQYLSAKANVGALMGPRSNGLTDVDLDCREAVALASPSSRKQIRFTAVPVSADRHHLYTCQDPEPKANIKLLDENGGCIVELRLGGGGKGAQSVMPGSIHTSGERYQMRSHGKPAAALCAGTQGSYH